MDYINIATHTVTFTIAFILHKKTTFDIKMFSAVSGGFAHYQTPAPSKGLVHRNRRLWHYIFSD